jgi:hypothetical protein
LGQQQENLKLPFPFLKAGTVRSVSGTLERVSNLDWSKLDPRNQVEMAGFCPAFDVHCGVYVRIDTQNLKSM